MICISISQESRPLALVDMLNAGPQCDLLEIRLDRFKQIPDLKELLAHKPKPVILTCLRAEDGGDWGGQEPERLALLRQCVASQADYVEIELDVADQIKPQPPAKRVISYLNLLETPENLAEIYAQALTKHPDVIKLVVPARTPEEVWPILPVLAKPPVPTVVVGLGKPGIMLSLLARRMGAPWTYAALEKGMEAHHGQTTVADLENTYHYRSINRTTSLVGVAGFGELQCVNVGLLNAALAALEVPIRCLPLEIGDLHLFRRVLEAGKMTHAIIDPPHQSAIREIVKELKPSAHLAEAADFITHQEGKWQGYNLLHRAVLAALEKTVRAGKPGDRPFQGQVVLFVGANGLARVLATAVHQAGATPVLASPNKFAGEEMARELGCRFIRPEAIASTPHDVVIRCDETEMDPESLKAERIVLDLTALPRKSAILTDAEQRGCRVVPPEQVLVELVSRQARAIGGGDVSREPLFEKLRSMLAS
jgi:3-dehydroquinate dehydratase/shikimate dehydrogenase